MSGHDIVGLIGFLVAVTIVASSGAIFRPEPWYDGIRKPAFTPPRWVFPAVWTPLYLIIALSGWLVWRRSGLAPVPFTFYGLQLVLNAAWSGLFFGLRRPDLALVDLALLWLAVLATILTFAPIEPLAAWLLVPYLAWGSFAAALNIAILKMNGRHLAKA